MCQNCNCDIYEKCSIVGYMPIGFCCTYCILHDERHVCLGTEKVPGEKEEQIKIISSTIEGKLLRVVI